MTSLREIDLQIKEQKKALELLKAKRVEFIKSQLQKLAGVEIIGFKLRFEKHYNIKKSEGHNYRLLAQYTLDGVRYRIVIGTETNLSKIEEIIVDKLCQNPRYDALRHHIESKYLCV